MRYGRIYTNFETVPKGGKTMVLELTEDLKTGVEEMDKDHQMLVDYLNEVYAL